MTGPDFYVAAAQLVPVLLLAIIFQFRYANPLARRLMDADIKIDLLLEGSRRAKDIRGDDYWDRSTPTNEESEAQSALMDGRRRNLTAEEFLRHAERVKS